MNQKCIEENIKKINNKLDLLRIEKSYKVAGIANSSIEVVCEKCKQVTKVANTIYDTKEDSFICFNCIDQESLKKSNDFFEWFDFDDYEYF
jgi:hypothetical protein